MRNLTPREAGLVAIATSLVVAALLWTMIVAPALASRNDSFAQLRKIDILWAVLEQLPGSFVDAPSPSTQPLRERVTASARAAAIDIRRLDPQGTSLSVSLDAVPFATLIGWFETLTTTANIQILSAEIGRRPEPGIVSVRVVMEDAR